MTSPPDPMAAIRAAFLVECDELLETVQDALQALDAGQQDAETIHVMFRAVHSIKGGAGAFGMDALVRFAHGVEAVLERMRGGTLGLDDGVIKVLFQASDHLSDLVLACRDASAVAPAQSQALLEALAALSTKAPSERAAVGDPPPREAAYQITFKPHAELFETGNDPALVLACLEELGTVSLQCDTSEVPPLGQLVPEIPNLSWTISLTTSVSDAEVASVFEFVEGLCTLDIQPPEAPASDPQPAPAPASGTAPATPAPAAVVRVDLERIERLVNLVGELVINQAMLTQSLEAAGLSPHSEAMNGLEEFQHLTRDIQDSVMMIRAQPVKSLFQRMARIVREASTLVDKEVRLRTQGDATEVDKTVIERLADPLTHMIRNAVAHGIEDPATRQAAGKPALGEVRLTAAHRSGRVVIEVSDDGAGIDRAAVWQLAQERGLIAADAQLSDGEIDGLLFSPGLSTSADVTDLSGRGVGMDVVRSEIQALGGRISIQSVPGRGTAFSISLPLTLAVLEGMVITLADQTLVLPLNMVSETLTLEPGAVQVIVPGSPALQLRDAFVPVIDLGAALGYRAELTQFEGHVALLIQHEDGARAALVVDDILDQRQVVIKGLNDGLTRAQGVAAATILGDGRIALILDPWDIIGQSGLTAGLPGGLPTRPAPLEGQPA